MHIRDFRLGDEQAIRSVFYASVHELAAAHYTEAQINAWASKEVDPATWANHIQTLKPFVVEVDGHIVAYADLQADGLIDHFFVSPAFSRQGIGTLLMEHINKHAQKKSLDHLFAHVSITAKPFFKKWGFEVERAQIVTLRGVQLDNFLMYKKLE